MFSCNGSVWTTTSTSPTKQVMEILYGAMTDGARRLTVREFLHCYHPDEIDKSRGMYSFASRSPLLKVIFETLDSNRDWMSRYFFLEGDEWMYRPGETEYMPVDITWGVLHSSRMHPSYFCKYFLNSSIMALSSNRPLSLQVDGAQKLVLRSLASSRRFSRRPSRKKGLGQSWWIQTPSTGIVTVLSPLLKPSDTTKEFTDVSPSTFTLHK